MVWRRSSIEFCGVKLIRLGAKPRRAIKIVYADYLVALLPNGTCGISTKSPFEFPRTAREQRRGYYLNADLAENLFRLGVISAKVCQKHKFEANREAKNCDARRAADDLEYDAERAGITLTKVQRRKIAELQKA